MNSAASKTEFLDLAMGDLGMASAMAALDKEMQRKGVSKDTRSMVTNSFQLIYEYVPYCIEQQKDPTDKKVLAAFLANKGKRLSMFLGNDAVNCGAAIVDFILSIRRSQAAHGFGPIAWVLAYGLAMLNLIEMGNQCEPAQRAYYELFLKQSEVKLQPVRSQVAPITLH